MRQVLLSMLAMVLFFSSAAHTIRYDLDKVKDTDLIQTYFKEGFQHIIPLGLDHILFVVCVFFLNSQIKKVLLQATIFTLAHSITLALAIYGYIKPPSSIIEPLIALSIVFLAFENIYAHRQRSWSMLLIFLFGLVHGMGFASALSELGLPRYAFASSLVSFNIGVEIGQLMIILSLYLISKSLSLSKLRYRKLIVIPTNVVIVLVASYWTIDRIFFNS